VISETGSLECLAADRKAGHGSSFDLVIVDETGLFPERARELLAGLRSAISAKTYLEHENNDDGKGGKTFAGLRVDF